MQATGYCILSLTKKRLSIVAESKFPTQPPVNSKIPPLIQTVLGYDIESALSSRLLRKTKISWFSLRWRGKHTCRQVETVESDAQHCSVRSWRALADGGETNLHPSLIRNDNRTMQVLSVVTFLSWQKLHFTSRLRCVDLLAMIYIYLAWGNLMPKTNIPVLI